MIINLRLTHREPGGGRSPATTTKSCSQGRSWSCRCNQTEAEAKSRAYRLYWQTVTVRVTSVDSQRYRLFSGRLNQSCWSRRSKDFQEKSVGGLQTRRGTHQSESWTMVTFLTGWRNETNVKEPKSWSSKRPTSWESSVHRLFWFWTRAATDCFCDSSTNQMMHPLDMKQLITTSMHLLSVAYSLKCFSVC